MKKAFLATTALVTISGAAYAQGVTLSGFAEMGSADGGSGDPEFHQDVDVTFKMEAMTDASLTSGTAVDLDEAAGSGGSDDFGVAAYIKGPFGNVTLGDTDGPNVLGLGGSNFYGDGLGSWTGTPILTEKRLGAATRGWSSSSPTRSCTPGGWARISIRIAYPNAVLVPFVPRNLNTVPRFWMTVEGEALLAETILVPWTPVSDLTVADLGPWENEGYRNRPVATIAYHQPITRDWLKDIFGKEISHDLIGRLHARGLIGTGPRSPRRGAPYSYVTTDKFLVAFDLETLQDLPDREQLEDAGLGAA